MLRPFVKARLAQYRNTRFTTLHAHSTHVSLREPSVYADGFTAIQVELGILEGIM